MLSRSSRAIPIRSVWKRFSSYSDTDVVSPADHFDSIPTVEGILGPNGLMAAKDPSYEHRQAQIDMAKRVYDNFTKHRSTMIIEAPTGVGKTLAYLIPSILAQMMNRKSKRPIVISTNTKALQNQIMEKEKPMIERSSGLRLVLQWLLDDPTTSANDC
jgi:superfamily II DNA or RNA helicase